MRTFRLDGLGIGSSLLVARRKFKIFEGKNLPAALRRGGFWTSPKAVISKVSLGDFFEFFVGEILLLPSLGFSRKSEFFQHFLPMLLKFYTSPRASPTSNVKFLTFQTLRFGLELCLDWRRRRTKLLEFFFRSSQHQLCSPLSVLRISGLRSLEKRKFFHPFLTPSFFDSLLHIIM